MTKSEQLKRDAEFEITHPNDPDYGKKAYLFRMGKLEEYINAVIAERMPSEEECVEWAKDETVEIDGGDNKRITFYLMVGAKWLRSRLSQKTEGGGE